MGARVTSGRGSRQDYATPDGFMESVMRRFGPVAFDLAAHAGNAKSPYYFAPVTGPEGPLPFDPEAYGMDAFDHSWSKLSCETFFDPHYEEQVESVVSTRLSRRELDELKVKFTRLGLDTK